MKSKKRIISIILFFFVILSNILVNEINVKAVSDLTPSGKNAKGYGL